jgi:S1-C subfamily serine protease
VTNYHVIDGAESVAIATYDGKEYEIEAVVDFSKEKDIAILKAKDNNKKFQHVNIHNPGDTIEIGSKVTSIGHPLGINYAITQGIISGIYEFNNVKHIQFDAPISNGNSGGPVFNDKGEVIAISTFSFAFGEDINFGIYIGEIFDLEFDNLRIDE